MLIVCLEYIHVCCTISGGYMLIVLIFCVHVSGGIIGVLVDYTCVVGTYVWWDTWRYHDDYTHVGGIYEVWGCCMDDDYIYIYHVHHSLHLMTIVFLVVRESSVGLV